MKWNRRKRCCEDVWSIESQLIKVDRSAKICQHLHNYIVLYCIVLYCIVLYCIVLYCIVLYCIVLYCIVSHCRISCCIYIFQRSHQSQNRPHLTHHRYFILFCRFDPYPFSSENSAADDARARIEVMQLFI